MVRRGFIAKRGKRLLSLSLSLFTVFTEEQRKERKALESQRKRSAGIPSGTIVIIIIFSQCRLTKVTLNA